MAKKSKGNALVVDFKGVEVGGGRVVVPDGDYLVKVSKVVSKKGEESGKPYLEWMLELLEGPGKGKKIRHTTSLQPHALWNLRATLEALGFKVPDSAMEIDLKALIGLQMMVTTGTEVYQGKKKSVVTDVFNPEDREDEDEDDENEEVGEDEDEEDDEEDEEEDDEEEEDDSEDDEEEEEDDEEDEEEAPPPPKKGKGKSGSKSKGKSKK